MAGNTFERSFTNPDKPIRSAVETARFIIAHEKSARPLVDNFDDVFDPAQIERDKEVVRAIKRRIESDYDHLEPEDQEKIKAGKT